MHRWFRVAIQSANSSLRACWHRCLRRHDQESLPTEEPKARPPVSRSRGDLNQRVRCALIQLPSSSSK